MKNLVLIVVLIGMIACDDNGNDAKPNRQAKISEIESVVKEGQWIVTYFWDTDKDETSDFTGYTFTFAPNSTVTAVKNATAISGQWSVTSDDNSNDDDNSLDDVDFNLSFSAPSSFEELSEDWRIISMTSKKIELTHVSGGNGGTDFLTFEKD